MLNSTKTLPTRVEVPSDDSVAGNSHLPPHDLSTHELCRLNLELSKNQSGFPKTVEFEIPREVSIRELLNSAATRQGFVLAFTNVSDADMKHYDLEMDQKAATSLPVKFIVTGSDGNYTQPPLRNIECTAEISPEILLAVGAALSFDAGFGKLLPPTTIGWERFRYREEAVEVSSSPEGKQLTINHDNDPGFCI
jgi:hypothetical protein